MCHRQISEYLIWVKHAFLAELGGFSPRGDSRAALSAKFNGRKGLATLPLLQLGPAPVIEYHRSLRQLLGVKRTLAGLDGMSAFDPKRTSAADVPNSFRRYVFDRPWS